MAQRHLANEELLALEVALNRFEPVRLRETLAQLGEPADRGSSKNVVASGPIGFGSVRPGAMVYRGEGGEVRLRVTVAEMTGGFYDEYELSDTGVARLARAVVERLRPQR